jgi:2-polyprenyl-6-methoxyphenol hydroxylase-like FAD-dependent oxidoreductase
VSDGDRNDADVIVVGGGIAGLGLACALAQHGVSVLVLEKRRAPGGIHRGDSLLPRTTGWFARWGVLDAIRAAGAVPIERLEIHDRGRKVCQSPLVQPWERDPYLVLPHAKIEHVLTECALVHGHATIERPARVTDVIREQGRVRGVTYETPQGSREARARLVVACDGHRSTVRARLGIACEPHFYDHAYLGMEADIPEGYQPAMRIHLHADGGLLLMPRTTRIGIGALVPARSGEQWIRMPEEELRRRLVARAPLLENVTLHRDGAHVYELVRAHADRYVADQAVIIGDAAHATNPAAGQGMTMALGDAGRLAQLVGPAIRANRDLAPILDAYQREQWPKNAALIRGSHLLANLYALRGPAWTRTKLAAVRLLASPLARGIVEPVVKTFLQGEKDDAPRPTQLQLSSEAALTHVDEQYEEATT